VAAAKSSWRAVRPKSVFGIDGTARSKALWDAIRSNSENTVRHLLSEDPSLADNTLGSNKNTVLHAAVPYGNIPIIKLLLRCLSKLDKNESGIDPLMSALWQGSEEVVLVILLSHHKLDMSARFEDGNTFLHQAALSLMGNRVDDVIFALVERGANVNDVNPQQETPLHVAVRANNEKAVRSLLDCGARVMMINQKQETPLDIAKKNSASTIIPLLEEACLVEKMATITPTVSPDSDQIMQASPPSACLSEPANMPTPPSFQLTSPSPASASSASSTPSSAAELTPPPPMAPVVTVISPPGHPQTQPPATLPSTYISLRCSSNNSSPMLPPLSSYPMHSSQSFSSIPVTVSSPLFASTVPNIVPSSSVPLSPQLVSTKYPTDTNQQVQVQQQQQVQAQQQQQQQMQQPSPIDEDLADYEPSYFKVYK